MYESGHKGPQYDPLPDHDDLALRPQEAAPDLTDLDAEPELLGPARPADRSWGTLAASAVLAVALLGAFLWFNRSSAPRMEPPPYAPPVAEPAAPPAMAQPAPPAAAEAPEIVEEPDDATPFEPEEPTVELAPGPPRTRPPVQTAEVVESPKPEPAAPKRTVKPERPRSREPVRLAAARGTEAPVVAPKRAVYGPPADRMAGVLRPGPGVEMPVPLELPRARYPAAARGTGLKVDVHLDLLVDEQGRVIEAVVREGDPDNLGFNEAAVQAALGTRFQPATRWDLPGKAWTELILEFEEPALEPERGR
jgi:TonB family protein